MESIVESHFLESHSLAPYILGAERNGPVGTNTHEQSLYWPHSLSALCSIIATPWKWWTEIVSRKRYDDEHLGKCVASSLRVRKTLV